MNGRLQDRPLGVPVYAAGNFVGYAGYELGKLVTGPSPEIANDGLAHAHDHDYSHMHSDHEPQLWLLASAALATILAVVLLTAVIAAAVHRLQSSRRTLEASGSPGYASRLAGMFLRRHHDTSYDFRGDSETGGGTDLDPRVLEENFGGYKHLSQPDGRSPVFESRTDSPGDRSRGDQGPYAPEHPRGTASAIQNFPPPPSRSGGWARPATAGIPPAHRHRPGDREVPSGSGHHRHHYAARNRSHSQQYRESSTRYQQDSRLGSGVHDQFTTGGPYRHRPSQLSGRDARAPSSYASILGGTALPTAPRPDLRAYDPRSPTGLSSSSQPCGPGDALCYGEDAAYSYQATPERSETPTYDPDDEEVEAVWTNYYDSPGSVQVDVNGRTNAHPWGDTYTPLSSYGGGFPS